MRQLLIIDHSMAALHRLQCNSAFSKRCFELVSSRLQQYPIELRLSNTGWGLFSTRDIKHTEEVLRENPILDFEAGCQGNWGFDELFLKASRGTKFDAVCHDSHYGVAAMVQRAMPELPVKPSESLHWLGLCWMTDIGTGKLHSSLSDEDTQIRADIVQRMFGLDQSWWGVEEYRLLESKWKTNVIGQQLYLVASKFNHSCRGNIAWNPLNIKASIIATRDVKKGEQLFYPYKSADLPREERRKALQDLFGFDCNCELCKSGG